MTWTEAVETVVARTGHERYRELCADDRPDHEAWRAKVIAKVTGQPAPAPSYPSLATQAGNAIGAAVRFVASGGATVDQAEQERRLGICRECEHFDAEQGRCRVCGCFAKLKARLESEHCPLPE